MTGVIADILQMKDAWGIGTTFGIIMTLVVIYLLWLHFKTRAEVLKARTNKSEETLELLRKSILLDSGQSVSIVNLVDVIASLDKKFSDNCDGCVKHRKEVDDIGKEVEVIKKEVETFVTEGRQSRQVTQDVINSISVKLDQLSKEIIATLRLGLGVRNKSGEE